MKDIRTAIFAYCSYQERCHTEVRNKLLELGARHNDLEELMAALISADALNEGRFAKAFARGKFRMKHWGKNRIRHELKAKGVSEYCIAKGIREIGGEEYSETLKSLARKKLAQLDKEKSTRTKQAKLFRYLFQKGYEPDMIREIITEILSPG